MHCDVDDEIHAYFREFGLAISHALNAVVQLLIPGAREATLRTNLVCVGDELRRSGPSALDLEFEDYRGLQWTLSHCWELRWHRIM